MSKFNAFRSGGRVDQRRGVFNFEDEFGRDPIRDRYANTTLAARDSESRVRLAASEIDLAKASLEASLRPAKVASDFFTQLNSASTAKAELESKARTQAQAIKLRERLKNANDYDSLTGLRADPELSDAFEDETIAGQYDAKLRGLRARGIATLQNRLPKATSTAEVDGLVNEYSWLAGDQEAQTLINTFTPLAQRREAAIKGLVEAGAQQMPLTSTGEFDVDRAERALSGTYTSSDINALQRREANIAKRLADVELMDPDGEEATQLRAQMSSVTDQLNSAASQQERRSIVARGELERLGVGQKGWQAGFIYGDQPDEQPQQTEAAAPPAPAPVSAPSPEPKKPEPKKPDSRVAKTQQSLNVAREEAGLAQQPWGIRQINEALSVDNAKVREKAARARQARESIDPYADGSLQDPQEIQNALRIVYPEIGEDTNRFDVGSAEDPNVIFAAEYLQRVDPSLLKRIAASPGRGGRRGSLTFDELPELAKRATSMRSKVRTGAPRGSRE